MPTIRNVRPLRIALAGCGVVGGELLSLLDRRRRELLERHGRYAVLARVLVRDEAKPRRVALDRDLVTSDVSCFTSTPADVVVEAIGGLRPAEDVARSALARGTALVTANKALIAARGAELAELARSTGAPLRFSAAVGGGVPMLELLGGMLGGGEPLQVRGILNGTSNFVLTLLERGATTAEALNEARRSGFAEADVSRDLDGRDAADKLALLAWSAFGIEPGGLIVRRRGLLPDPARLVRLAGSAGGCLRLVAEFAQVGGGVVASVEPVVLPRDSPLGRTSNEENRIELDHGWSAPLAASGPGAGGTPTATALLADLLAPGGAPPQRLARVAAAADRRAFSWLVAASAAAPLRAALRRSGIQITGDGGHACDHWAMTAPVPWDSLQPVLAALAGHGAAPVVARVQL